MWCLFRLLFHSFFVYVILYILISARNQDEFSRWIISVMFFFSWIISILYITLYKTQRTCCPFTQEIDRKRRKCISCRFHVSSIVVLIWDISVRKVCIYLEKDVIQLCSGNGLRLRSSWQQRTDTGICWFTARVFLRAHFWFAVLVNQHIFRSR